MKDRDAALECGHDIGDRLAMRVMKMCRESLKRELPSRGLKGREDLVWRSNPNGVGDIDVITTQIG